VKSGTPNLPFTVITFHSHLTFNYSFLYFLLKKILVLRYIYIYGYIYSVYLYSYMYIYMLYICM